MTQKVLAAYFSASGVTAKMARALAEVTGADLHEIQPALPYTSADLDWMDKESRSSIEMNDPKSRPAIGNTVENVEQYDIIFIGFPIWWYIAPTIINTFLESYDLSGKTIIPFATSGGSGMGESEKILKKSCSATVNWKPGKRLISTDKAALKTWINTLDL